MISRRNALGLIGSGISTFAIGRASAAGADYPTRPVRWIVGYPPGGATDILARLIGQRLSERLGQQFVVENKPGAGNNIGTESVVNAEPDGYTVLLINPANYINATLYANLKFNFIRDIAPIAAFQRVPNVMTVNKDVPAKSVAEFIDYVKANPGKVNMASSGNGTSVHGWIGLAAGSLHLSRLRAGQLHMVARMQRHRQWAPSPACGGGLGRGCLRAGVVENLPCMSLGGENPHPPRSASASASPASGRGGARGGSAIPSWLPYERSHHP